MAERKKADSAFNIVYPAPTEDVQVSGGLTFPIIDIPISKTFFGKIPEVSPQKKSDIDFSQFQEQIAKLNEELERLKSSQGEKSREESKIFKDVKPLETVQFLMESPFILLPLLSSVLHPLYVGTSRPLAISVGSISWLHTLDQLRTMGWPFYGEYGIEMFLLKSAWIVKQELNYTVIKRQQENEWVAFDMDSYQGDFEAFQNDVRNTKYINNIEKFCTWYPDQTRQEERLEKGYSKLINDIKSSLGPYAFLPQNYNNVQPGEELKCPPKDVEFYIGDEKVKGFLEFWTEYDKLRPTYVKVGNQLKTIYECTPPFKDRFAWIPIKYRAKIEEMYNLIQFKYNSDTFQKYLYTLLKYDTLDKSLRNQDEQGKEFIIVQGPNKIGYKLYIATLQLNFGPHEKRLGVPDGELTLREWMEKYTNDRTLDPLFQAILNAPAPQNEGIPGKPGLYKDNIYNSGRNGMKMFADAPVRIFKHQLVKTIIRNVNPGEQYADCRERFISGMYDFIYNTWAPKIENFPTEVPARYREILTELFEYGGQSDNCQFSTLSVLSQPTRESISPAPMEIITLKQLQKMSEKELKARIEDTLNIVKKLA